MLPSAATLLLLAALSGPPWISIELPANPWDRQASNAYLLVHAFHHGTAMDYPITGRAEGVVNGERKTIALRFGPTERTGVYSLTNQWGQSGRWVLVITVSQGADDVAEAVVRIRDGVVLSVTVPTRDGRDNRLPRRATAQEVDAALAETTRP